MAGKTTKNPAKARPGQTAASPRAHGANGHARHTPAIAPSKAAVKPELASLDLGSIEYLQVVNEAGKVVRADRDPKLSKSEFLRIHRAMVLTRKLDIRMLNMQRQGEMGTFAPGLGQEATQIGQIYPLQKKDWFAPSYRSFGAQLWRGWTIEQLLLLWDGFHIGFPPPEGVNDLPMSIVIGSHTLPAVGIAQGIQYRGDDAVVLANFGDGAMSQGAVNEAFNFAAIDNAPVVFVCENNGWAISMPVEKQAATPWLAQRGIGFGIPSIRVDGNDVLAMIAATKEAVERARNGGGPTFIEAVTYRMSYHTTADEPKVYRSEDKLQPWESKDPIARFEKHLIERGMIDHAGCGRVAEDCEQEVLAARETFRAQAKPNPHEVFDFVYGELTPELREQRADYFARLKRKGVSDI